MKCLNHLALFTLVAMCAADRPHANVGNTYELRRYNRLKKGRDFTLDFRTGSATFVIKMAFSRRFELEMKEELSALYAEPNPEIEMCNGTVTDDLGNVGTYLSQPGGSGLGSCINT